ncbi:unnamed protein product [Phaedon cochleariae]|uniref:Uncharacterized protein n=1 Tax=Phaedon cochleariae TaxID=80249 RepID=A0A9P0GV15_PHACE|nr:unnamed protein product [Phaedon cochleariae]
MRLFSLSSSNIFIQNFDIADLEIMGDEQSMNNGNQMKSSSTDRKYDVSAENNQRVDQPVPSTSSIKSRKSSNLLSAFVKRTRKKNKVPEVQKSIDIASQNLDYVASNSTLGIHTEEEVELIVENYETKIGDSSHCNRKMIKSAISSDSEHSLPPALKIKHQFFRKFMKKHTQNDKLAADLTREFTIRSENTRNESSTICENQHEGDHKSTKKNFAKDEVMSIITSFIKSPENELDFNLLESLRTVQELTARLDESKSHLLHIFKEYLKDESIQHELIDTLAQHSKLHLDIERKTNSLTNEMWVQQVEIGRRHEGILQETINRLVKQNRKLQIDYEVLFRKHQEVVSNLPNSHELGSKQKSTLEDHSQMMQLISHNKKLQRKLENAFQQLQFLENEISSLQKQNSYVEELLTASSGEIFELKTLLHRSRTNHDLDKATFKIKVYTTEKKLKDAFEAGDRFIEELADIQLRLKSIDPSMNWPISICKNNVELVDVIEMTRCAFSDLFKKLMKDHIELAMKNKEVNELREINTNLEENLKKSAIELSKQIDNTAIVDTASYVKKIKLLEDDVTNLHDNIEKIKLEHDMEKNTLLKTISQFEYLNNEILEKNTMIEQTKMFINSITSENMALRSQVDGLNRLLSETGAGDVVKELSTNQEQLLYYQTQYHQLVHEKQQLKDHQEVLQADNKAMLDQQETNYKHLQKQLKELESIARDNKTLRQQLELERQTVSSLQNERKKYLEEKNLLKTIFHHMKTEISRVQKLEGTVADISKEANKLAMIAEYNKQVGHKLKSEIVAKDKTILQLKSSVEKLNDIQIKNTKEKLSLCYELSEVCQIKDQLNSVLSFEVQKNADLDNSTKKIAQTASSQIKMYEEFQRKERYVLKDLVRDLRSVVKQRDTLQKEKEENLKELEEKRTTLTNQQNRIDELLKRNHESEEKLKNLQTKYDYEKTKVQQLNDTLSKDSEKYGDNVKKLEMLILQLREETEERQKSIQYLQNNIQKLYRELNESRKDVKETKDLLNKSILEKNSIEAVRDRQQRTIETMSEEKEKLAKEVERVNALSEKILSDFETNIKSSMEKEDLLKKELDESKAMIMKSNRDLEHISGALAVKQDELQKVTYEYTSLRQREKQHIEVIKCLENQKSDTREMRNKKEKLENELIDIKADYDNIKAELINTQRELEKLYRQLNSVMEEKEQEYQFYKKHMDDSLRNSEEIQEKTKSDLNELKMHLTDISQKLENERSAYSALSQIHKEVSAKFIKSIKDVVDEKNACQEATLKLKEVRENLENLKSEKADLQQQVNILLDGLNDGKNRINTLTQERDNLKSSLDDLQKRYNDLLRKCLALENQIRGTDLNKDAEYESLKNQLDNLKKESLESNNLIISLKQDADHLSQEVTNLEFQKSELTLRLHETQRKFETENSLCEQLKNTHMVILSTILKMKDDGTVDANHCNNLLHMAQNDFDLGYNIDEK